MLSIIFTCVLVVAATLGLTEGGPGLLTNVGFESDFTGWSRTADWAIDAATAYSGAKSALCAIPRDTDSYICQGHDYGANIAGQDFIISAWLKTENVTKVWVRTYWRNASGQWIWHGMNSASLTGTNDWTKVTVEGAAPGGATQAWILVAPAVRDGVGRFWVDQCAVEEKPRPNLLPNPGFEDRLNGWSRGGTWMAVADAVHGGASAAYCQVPPGGDTYVCRGYDFGRSIAGTGFRATAWLKTENATRVWLRTYWKDAGGHWIWQEMNSVSLSGTNDWTRVAVDGVAPPGATQAWVLAAPAVLDGLGAFWVDDCGLEELPPPNLLYNGDFEDDLNSWSRTAGWSCTSGEHHAGGKSALCEVPFGGDIYLCQGWNFGRVIEGTDFAASAWIKTEDATGVRLRTYWRNANNNWIWRDMNSVSLTGTNDWTLLMVEGTAPPGATQAWMLIAPVSADGQGRFWVDSCRLAEKPRPNLLLNGGFEDDLNSWSRSGPWSAATGLSYTGTKSLLCQIPAGGDNYACQGRDYGQSIAGKDFVASAWLKTENVTKVWLRTYWRDAHNRWIWRDMNSVVVTGTSDWTRVAVEGTAPLGATQAWMLIAPAAADGVGRFWVDECRLEEKPRPNLLSNPGFEDDLNAWSRAGGPWTIDPAQRFAGNKTAHCMIPATGDTYVCQGFDYGRDIAGLEFRASAWVKTQDATKVWVRTYWKNAQNAWIWQNMESASLSGTVDWTQLSVTGTAPVGATQAWILVAPAVRDGLGEFWVDNVRLEERVRPNLLANAGFEDDLNSWSRSGTWSAQAGGARYGAKCAKLEVPPSGDVYICQGRDYDREIAGGQFLMSAWLKTQNATKVWVRTYWKNANGAWIWQNMNSAVLTGTNDWTRLTVEGTAPAGATQAWIIIAPAVKDGVGTLWVDGCTLEPKRILTFTAQMGTSPGSTSFAPEFFLPQQIVSYEWDFNADGLPDSYQTTPAYTFPSPGDYTVWLKVTADDGSVYEAVRTVTVAPSLAIEISWTEGGGFVLTASSPGAEIATVTWDFGDGNSYAGPEKQIVHAYREGGTYQVRAEATATDGGTATATITIEAPPSVEAMPSATSDGITASFAANAVVHYGGQIVAAVWDFGDGTGAETENATHVYPASGTYQSALTLTDSFGYTYAFPAPAVTVAAGVALSLADGETVRGVIRVTGRVTGAAEVASLSILLDGLEQASVDGNPEVGWDWDTFLAANGEHEVTMRVVMVGGKEASLTETVGVNNPFYRITITYVI